MNATKTDAVHARQIARGFGVKQRDIKVLTNATVKELNETFTAYGKSFKSLAKVDKRAFLMVYCACHGVADQQQWMVLNATSGNVYNIEGQLKTLIS